MARVLLVEDEEILRKSLAMFLRNNGHEVVEAEDEAGALELLKAGSFNLVVADIFLGNGNGLGLMSYINEHSPRVKCIAITGHASLDYAIQALRKGVTDYLLKPFKYTELVAAMDKALKSQAEEKKVRKFDVEEFSRQYRLTGKEQQIVSTLVTQGLSNDDLAEVLNISVNTVKVHLRNIFKKVGVESKTALASKLLAMGEE
jgi:DNA-binding NarL/FixJ family response regulator